MQNNTISVVKSTDRDTIQYWNLKNCIFKISVLNGIAVGTFDNTTNNINNVILQLQCKTKQYFYYYYTCFFCCYSEILQ